MPFEIAGAKIAPGTYVGVLERVEKLPSVNPQYPGEFRKWHFLVDVNGSLQTITATTSLNTGPQSKAYAWLSALLRRELRAGESIPDPVGQRASIVIADNKKGYSSIQNLLPLNEPEQVVAGIPR